MRHPIEAAIRQFTYMKARATRDDLAEFGLDVLPGEAQDEILAAIDRCLELRAGGATRSDGAAIKEAQAIIASLPAKWRDPKSFGRADPLANVTDPEQLAAAVPRG